MKTTSVLLALVGMGIGGVACNKSHAANTPIASPTPMATPSATTTAPVAPVAMEQEEIMSAPFKVEQIDKANRKMVVESPDGTRSTVTISPDAKDFEHLKKGDEVELDYYGASVLELEPSRTAPAGRHPVATTSGAMPASKAQQVTASARVTSIDTHQETMQVKTADGQTQTLHVQNPTLQHQLQSLKSGDQVSVTYTEPTAVGLRKK